MLSTDKDALICDFAETYHIYDYKSFPVSYIATLASGLPDSSRIKLKLAKMNITLEQMLLAQAIDALNLLVWSKTKDAQSGSNKPKSVYRALTGARETEKEIKSFKSGEEFKKAFEAITGE